MSLCFFFDKLPDITLFKLYIYIYIYITYVSPTSDALLVKYDEMSERLGKITAVQSRRIFLTVQQLASNSKVFHIGPLCRRTRGHQGYVLYIWNNWKWTSLVVIFAPK